MDFLVSAETEELLAGSDSRNLPVRPALRARLGLESPGAGSLTYEQIADHMTEAVSVAREILLR